MADAGPARQDSSRRARIAAQRAAAQKARVRKRLLIAGGAVVVVVAVVLALVFTSGGNSGSPTAASQPGPTGASLAQVVSQVTSVPAAELDQVGAGQATSVPSSITGSPLTSGGKPEMFYLGAEYCPYCAAERWAMIVALSRFGTFSGLAAIRSAASNGAGNAEPFPLTPTFTFAHATYASNYLTFTPVEEFTNIPDKSTGGYTPLQTPTAAQQALVQKYDAANQGAIPFIDFGNKYTSVGASYNPGVLSGLTWSQIATDLHNPSSSVAKSVLGAANYLTAAICGLTGNQPTSACTPTVQGLQSKL